jgi:cation transport ATPase
MLLDVPRKAPPPPPPRVRVRWGPRTLELSDEEVFGAGSSSLCVQFLQRVFSVEEVDSVQVDRGTGSAVVRYRRGTRGAADLLHRMAAAIRGAGTEPSNAGTGPAVRLLPQDLSGPHWTIHRHRHLLSTWEVVTEQPGTLALKHDLLEEDPGLARRVAHVMESVHGVTMAALRPLSGTLRIRFDPLQTQVERLLHALEAARQRLPAEPADDLGPEPASFGLANASVALAVLSEFVAPSLWPVTAAVLIGSNLGTFRDAAAQLGRGELGMPVLYASIAAATLATGQFVPWAAMSWMMRFWTARSQHELAAGKRRLLGQLIQQQRFTRLEAPGGIEVEVPVERLGRGDVILVSAGEKLPLDGRILSGFGLVDERAVRGAAGLTRKRPEDPALAGSLVVAGDFRVEARPAPGPHRAAFLAQAALSAVSATPGKKTATLQGETYATRFVAPTMATAGLGLYLGGAPMALAVLRADYASGPGLTHPLETLQACAVCTRQGIVLRDPAALDLLNSIDVLLLDHHPALEAVEPEVAGVRVFPGYTEFQVLQYAASAFKDLDDERNPALRAACRSRRIALLDRIPVEFGADLTLLHRDQVVKVGNLGGQGLERGGAAGRPGRDLAPAFDSLMVGVNGQISGLIDFRLSDHLKAAGAIRALRERCRRALAIGLVSASDEAKVRRLATRLGVDFHRGGLSTVDLLQLIRGCRKRGLKVAYLGAGSARARAAREADLAIALNSPPLDLSSPDGPSIVLLDPDLHRLVTLDEVARDRRRRIRVAEGSCLIPNLCCAVGALFLGFSSVITVFVTNLGTYAAYSRTTAALGRLERRLRREGGRLARPSGHREASPL